MVASGRYKSMSTVHRILAGQYGQSVADDCFRWLHDYEDWQRGGLLVDGGLESQPAKWLQRCWIVDGVYAEQRRKDMEKARNKGKKGNG
jgi:hypothetical protein